MTRTPELLDWHLHIVRGPDARQGELFGASM
jgi:hypothetical protein